MSWLEGYDRRSRALLVTFVAVGSCAAVVWREHVSLRLEDADPLLAACWVGMALLAMHRVEPRRDGALAVVAFAGGALIEAWGTRSGLWVYFSREQPPLFILPAWPAAALATERVVRAVAGRLERLQQRTARGVYAVAIAGFSAWLLAWAWPGVGHPLTWVALGCVAITALTGADRRADLARFAGGALVGLPLEYWGTSRACWVYASGGTPPAVAVLAHGFATVAFARGVAALAALPRAHGRERPHDGDRSGDDASARTNGHASELAPGARRGSP